MTAGAETDALHQLAASCGSVDPSRAARAARAVDHHGRADLGIAGGVARWVGLGADKGDACRADVGASSAGRAKDPPGRSLEHDNFLLGVERGNLSVGFLLEDGEKDFRESAAALRYFLSGQASGRV